MMHLCEMICYSPSKVLYNLLSPLPLSISSHTERASPLVWSARPLATLLRSHHELNIRECCISCLAVNNSPKGQVVAGPSSASFVQLQNESSFCSCCTRCCNIPVVFVSFVPSFRFAVSLSMISLKGCSNI